MRVDNSLQPNCRWYTGSGIYRHTWLVVRRAVHIATWGVVVRTPLIDLSSAQVEVTTRVLNEGDHDTVIDLLVEIQDQDGRVVASGTTSSSLQSEKEVSLKQLLTVPTPLLWSAESPYLYSAVSRVRTRGADVDRDESAFGIRTVEFDVDRGFLLNHNHVKLNGVCLHGDGGAVGTAVPERVWERRLEVLKLMGCNSIRLTHNPPAPELLDMLDRMGFLVMAEAFDEWREAKGQTPDYGYHKYFDEWSDRDLAAMIERDRNHPSIVIWSAGNEVPDQSAPRGVETLERLLAVVREKDPTRLITVGCDEIAAEPKSALPEFLEKLDVVGYNYVDRWRERREKYYSIDRQDFPKRRFIGTESTAVYGARGVYEQDQANELFFERSSNTQIEVEQQQKFIQTYDYVSGDFIWAGIDYLGEARWPSKLAATGVLDTCGFIKDNYYFYQSLWTRTPVLHLYPHWNWAGKEGQVITVTCFTNCDTVELWLDGKSLGVKGFAFPRPGMVHEYGEYPARGKALQTTADLHLSWDVLYVPGTLRAKGVRHGKVVVEAEVQTTDVPAKVSLSADRQQIHNRWSDLSHVTVQILDKAGRLTPTAANEVTFELKGNGRILGVDNGRPESHESYKGNVRQAFNGMALVMVQSSGERGEIVLTATSPGLVAASISINCVP